MKYLIVFNWELSNSYDHRNQWKSELFYKGKMEMNISGRDVEEDEKGEKKVVQSCFSFICLRGECAGANIKTIINDISYI